MQTPSPEHLNTAASSRLTSRFSVPDTNMSYTDRRLWLRLQLEVSAGDKASLFNGFRALGFRVTG